MQRLSLGRGLVDPAHLTRLQVRRLPCKRPKLSQRDNGLAVVRSILMADEPGCVALSEGGSEACAAERDFDIVSLNLDLDLWLHLPASPPAWGKPMMIPRLARCRRVHLSTLYTCLTMSSLGAGPASEKYG